MPVRFPEKCPECGTPLIQEDGGIQHMCPNDRSCPPQILRRIEHFIGRKAMDIEGLGGETIAALYEAGMIRNVADLYDLQREQLLALGKGWGERKADGILTGLIKSREVPFERVLFALGIRHVGETVARKVARAAGSMDRLRSMGREELLAMDEVGEVIAESILEFFGRDEVEVLLHRLREAGLCMEVEATDGSLSKKLEGKLFVVSGVFENFSRDAIKRTIEAHGGKVSGSISSKTSFVLAGTDMGPAKRTKAEQLGVRILDENGFLEMIA